MRSKYNIQKAGLRFSFKALLFFALVFSMDFVFGKALSYYYFKQSSGLQYRTTYSIEQTSADVLIFGSSRANHHYFPEIFERNLKHTYYNVGRDGNFIFYNYAILKSVLKRYKPKTIILDFTKIEFIQEPSSYDRLSVLLPYYKTHPELREIIELKSKYERVKLLSQIYPYNSSLLTILAGNSEFNKKRKNDVKGYIAIDRKMSDTLNFSHVESVHNLDSLKVRYYQSFINECLSSKIEIFIVCSPLFNKPVDERCLDLGKRIAKKSKVPFFDFSVDSIFTGRSDYFADPEHLNILGSKVFSERVCKRIETFTDARL